MTTNSLLAEYESTYQPPEELADEYHPANTEFFRHLRHAERHLTNAAKKCKENHVIVAKLRFQGRSNVDIAEQIKVKPATVAQIANRDDVKELIGLMQHLSMLRDGPNHEHKKRFLWEIAVDSKELDPKTSISAVQEMNRMDGVGKEKHDTKIEVTINNELLPRGPLDQ